MENHDAPESARQQMYHSAWHGRQPYTEAEFLRLAKACRLIERHAQGVDASRPYRVLDVGCGVGPLRQWLPRERFHITGLEISAQAAEIARRNYDACEVADVESPWPIPPASFDCIHAGAIMEHVVDWHAPLNHANRAIADKGCFIISVPNLRYLKNIARLIRGRQLHWLTDVEHLHAYTPAFICKLVQLHGFEVTQVEADRVSLPLIGDRWQWAARWLAGFGAVLILAASLARRVRIEHAAHAHLFPNHKPAAMHSIEILDS